jgi:proteasome maturation protein
MSWRATQEAMKMEGLRRAYGIAEPVRRGMELKIVRDGTFRPAVLGGMRGGNVHEDILCIGGRDSEVQWEDIYQGMFLQWFEGMVMGLRWMANWYACR